MAEKIDKRKILTKSNAFEPLKYFHPPYGRFA